MIKKRPKFGPGYLDFSLMSELKLSPFNANAFAEEQSSKKYTIFSHDPGGVKIVFALLQKMIAIHMQFLLIKI